MGGKEIGIVKIFEVGLVVEAYVGKPLAFAVVFVPVGVELGYFGDKGIFWPHPRPLSAGEGSNVSY